MAEEQIDQILNNKIMLMRKQICTFITIVVFALGVAAEEFEITTIDGKKFRGDLVDRTETTLTLYNHYTLKSTTYFAYQIKEAKSDQGSLLMVEDGKIVGDTNRDIYEEKYWNRQLEEMERMSDPNYTIGKAMKVTGGITLGIGAPCLIVGTILLVSGQSDLNKLENQGIRAQGTAGSARDLKVDENCVKAGLALMPFGGALTIVGIPLYVHGSRIMDLSLQISENGPGVAVKF